MPACFKCAANGGGYLIGKIVAVVKRTAVRVRLASYQMLIRDEARNRPEAVSFQRVRPKVT